MIKITIASKAGLGKTAAAQVISTALRQAGMDVTVVDTDGDFGHTRPPEALVGKAAVIEMVQLAREGIGG